MSLGSNIVTALGTLSEADKRDIDKVWEAIGGEIEDYPSGSQSIIKDNRTAGDVTPADLPEKAIFFTFTDDIVGSPNTWDAVLNVKGWLDTYTAWQLFANSGVDDIDKNLYFRRGRNTTWDTLQKIWTDQNDGIASGLNADLLDGNHAAAFAVSGHNHDAAYYTETEIDTTLGGYFKLSDDETITGRPAFNGGVTGTSSPFTVDSTYKVANLNAALLNSLASGSFIRSDADDNVNAHTEWQDNKEIRLGTDADFRMLFNGINTYFKGYSHGASVYFQGEDVGGTNRTMLYMDPDGSVKLYYINILKLETLTDGAKITGTLESTIALKSPALELTAAGSKFYSPTSGEESLGTGHWRGNSSTATPELDQNPALAGTWYTITFADCPIGTKGVWAYVYSYVATAASHGVATRKKGDTVAIGNQLYQMYDDALSIRHSALCYFPLNASYQAEIYSPWQRYLRVYEAVIYDI